MATEKTSTLSASQNPAKRNKGNIQAAGWHGAAPTHSHRAKAQPGCYAPYGFRSTKTHPVSALGFNGEFLFAVLACYALGNGHRIYNPRLMRFISPDSWSPFSKGGLNTYAYCLNDPVNAKDPSGRVRIPTSIPRAIRNSLRVRDFLKGLGINLPPTQHSIDAAGNRPMGAANIAPQFRAIENHTQLQAALSQQQPQRFKFEENAGTPIFSVETDMNHAPPTGRGEIANNNTNASERTLSTGLISRHNGKYLITSPEGAPLNGAVLHLRSGIGVEARIDDIFDWIIDKPNTQ